MVKSAEIAQTAHDVEVAVRAHFQQPRYAVVTGVRNAAGWDARRTCDALAIGVWQSTQNDLHGVEIKVSRSDWQREMQDPLKAEAFAAYCDYWWIVATPDIVKIEELPVAWGLMETAGRGLRVRKPASKRESPLPVDRELLACFARRVCEQSPAEAIIAAAEKRGRDAAAAEYAGREKKREKRRLDWMTSPEEQTAKAMLDKFEAATGVKIEAWNVEETARGFKAFQEARSSLQGLRRSLEFIKDRVDGALKETEPPTPPPGAPK